jgi:protein-disulfide isomerase
MTKRSNSDGPPVRGGGASPGWVQLLTLTGLAGVLFVGTQNWMETRKVQTALNDRLTILDTKISTLSAKVDQGARPAQAQRGPDPNRVYSVRLDNAPFEGPASAPVVIAEFSDFQ